VKSFFINLLSGLLVVFLVVLLVKFFACQSPKIELEYYSIDQISGGKIVNSWVSQGKIEFLEDGVVMFRQFGSLSITFFRGEFSIEQLLGIE